MDMIYLVIADNGNIIEAYLSRTLADGAVEVLNKTSIANEFCVHAVEIVDSAQR